MFVALLLVTFFANGRAESWFFLRDMWAASEIVAPPE